MFKNVVENKRKLYLRDVCLSRGHMKLLLHIIIEETSMKHGVSMSSCLGLDSNQLFMHSQNPSQHNPATLQMQCTWD